jgi:hypothetical protein
MLRFIDIFGTHVKMSVDMGSKFVAKTTLSRKELSSVKANNAEVSFDATIGSYNV